ncbi:MAG: hypothetical protein R3F56_06735 [Planctomycetota bacterium]
MTSRWLALFPCLCLAPTLLSQGVPAPAAAAPLDAGGGRRLEFEPDAAGFVARSAGYGVRLASAGFTFAFGATHLVLHWDAARARHELRGEGRLAGQSHYFIGRDSAAWRHGVPHFDSVRCAGVWDGIDVVCYGQGQRLEFDFVVAPGATPAAIGWSYEGAQRVQIDAAGALHLACAGGELIQHAPVAYQTIDGERRAVPASYRYDGRRLGIEVGAYDRTQPLVVDPLVSYGTFLGGAGVESVARIARDAQGNTYLAGITSSLDFPIVGGVRNGLGGTYDMFVTKIDPTGSQLVYSTYVGGSVGGFGVDEWAIALDVDGQGRVTVLGRTECPDFPTVNAFRGAPQGGVDAVVFQLAANGASLAWSTYLGGSGNDVDNDVSFDLRAGGLRLLPNGDVVVGGWTASADFPLRNPSRATFANEEIFLTRFDAQGGVQWSTFFGGSEAENLRDLELDSNGLLVFAGFTISPDFPVSANAYDATSLGGYVTKLDPATQSVVWSTRYPESPQGIGLDARDAVYLCGDTTRTDMPVTMGAHQVEHGGSFDGHIVQGWLTRLDPSASVIEYATYYGTPRDNEYLVDVVADHFGQAYVVGTTREHINTPSGAALLLQMNAAGSALVYTMEPVGRDSGGGSILLLAPGEVMVAGETDPENGFTTAGAVQPTHGGRSDGFLARVSSPATGMLAFTLDGRRLDGSTTRDAVISLDGAAGPSGVVVQLQSSHPGVLQVPATVTVPAGSATVTVPLTAARVTGKVFATVTATAGGAPLTLDVKVWPGSPYRVVPVLVPPLGTIAQPTLAPAINEHGSLAITGAPRGYYGIYTDVGGYRTLGPGIANGINDLDHVCGETTSGEAFVHSTAQRTLGFLPSGSYSAALAINDRGQVAGTGDLTVAVPMPWHPFRYTFGVGLLDLTPASTTGQGTARAINRAGVVAGQAQLPAGMHAFTYANGAGLTDLGVLPGHTHSVAFAINDAGWVTGISVTGNFFEGDPFLYVPGSGMRRLPGLPGFAYHQPRGINSFGHVVGNAIVRAEHIGFVDDGVTQLRLDEELSPEDAFLWRTLHVYGINDRGQIAGGGDHRFDPGESTSLRLDPRFHQPYGRGCGGSLGMVPGLLGQGYPAVGGTFDLLLSGPAGGAAALLVAAAPGNTPVLGCSLALAAPFVQFGPAFVLDGAGTARRSVPLPAGLRPVPLFFQGAVVDPGAPSGLVTFSNGVRVQLF